MPRHVDEDGAILPPNSLTWDYIPAQKFIMSVLSSILYARKAFPADCFQIIEPRQIASHTVTHESLINSGKALSFSSSSRDFILSQDGPLLYFRRVADDFRLDRFLDDLRGGSGTLDAIQTQRLAKIQICFSRSKSWETSEDLAALIEFYSLKFRYNPDGTLYLFLNWGGTPKTAIPTDCANSLNKFLSIHPHIVGTNYVHYYISGTHLKPLNRQPEPGLRQSLKQAETILDGKLGSGGGRISTLLCYRHSDANFQQQNVKGPEAEGIARQLNGGSLSSESHYQANVPIINDPVLANPGSEVFEIPEWIKDLSHPSSAGQGQSIQVERGWPRPQFECTLSVIEEVLDDLPPTQLLTTQDSSQQPMLHMFSDDNDEEDDDEDDCSHLKRPMSHSLGPKSLSDRSQLAQPRFKRRSTERFIQPSSPNSTLRLDASQLGPLTLSPSQPRSKAPSVPPNSWQQSTSPPLAPVMDRRRSSRRVASMTQDLR